MNQVAQRRIHWHIVLTHFPISLFGVTFLFQVLHLFLQPDSFEAASNVTLMGGALAMIPTTWTGWATWRGRYKGATVPLFKKKIITAFVMLVLSVSLVLWRSLTYDIFSNQPYLRDHLVYFTGTALLIAGSVVEGYYGGRLNHH